MAEELFVAWLDQHPELETDLSRNPACLESAGLEACACSRCGGGLVPIFVQDDRAALDDVVMYFCTRIRLLSRNEGRMDAFLDALADGRGGVLLAAMKSRVELALPCACAERRFLSLAVAQLLVYNSSAQDAKRGFRRKCRRRARN